MLIDWDVGADLDASDADETLARRTVSSAGFSTIVRVSLSYVLIGYAHVCFSLDC